jgi:hypothetical protein
LRVVAAVGFPVVGVTDADVVGVVAAVVDDVFDDELELHAARPAAATNAMGTSRFTVCSHLLSGMRAWLRNEVKC